jgi:PAS domain S-box-containing protein
MRQTMPAPPATEHLRSRERAADALAPAILDALEEAPLGLAVFDRELRFAHVNAWLAEADGFPAVEHVGRTMAELFPDLPDAVHVVESRVRAVLETGQPTTFPIVRSAPDGTRREWVATYCPIRGPSSGVHGACGIILEVTAEREREAALARSRLEAERAARRLAYLQDVTAALAAATDTADVAKVIVDRARLLVGASSATIRALRGGDLELLAASGDFELRPRPRSISLEEDAPVACAVKRGEPIWLEDRAMLERRFPALVAVHRGDAAIATVPLSAGGRRLGALSFAFDHAQRFDLEERAAVLAAAAQCAQALDRALLHEAESAARDAAQRASARVARLQAVTAALSAASTVEEVAAVVVDAAHAALGAHTAVIYVHDPGSPTLSLAATVGHMEAPRRLARLTVDAPTPAARAARTGEASWIESPEELAAAFPGFASVYPPAAAIGAVAALPLRARGKVLGALGFAFEEARRFEPDERDLLSSVADQCGQALDRARLLDAERAARAEAQRVASRLARLQEITAALSAARTPEDIARTVTELVHPVVGAAVSAAYVLEPDGALRLLRMRGADQELAQRYARIPPGSPFPTCRAAATGEPVWLGSPAEVGAAFPQLTVLRDAPREAVVALPLRAGEQVIGAFGFTFSAPRPLDDAERGFFLAVAEQCAVALHRAQLLEGERRAWEEADRARSLLDAILENAPIGVGFFDQELRYQRLNTKLAEMNGLPIEAHLGRTPRELFPGIPNDEIERAFRRVIATGEPLLDLELVGEAPTGSGRRVWLESWYPVRGGGALMGVGAIVREVTKEREADEFQRHVVGVVGHDLRNPLSAILTAVKLLAAGDLRPAQARLLERVAGSAGRIEEIVGALLDFANVRAGVGVPIRPRRCDLAEVARAVAEECALAHPGREILSDGTGDCTGEWDPGRVAQLLANLVSNAIQYSPASAPVRLGWAGGAGEVLLEVANSGPPIPAELLPHLFEPFRRGDRQHRGGLGLGLFIARAIAVAHRGRIDVRSSEPGGTVFSVALPRGWAA